MKKKLLVITVSLVFVFSFLQLFVFAKESSKTRENPFLSKFDTPFGLPPFEKIKPAHYLEGAKEGIKQQRQEIRAIMENPAPPTFENTVVALETSGETLRRASQTLIGIIGVARTPGMQKMCDQFDALEIAHISDIYQNAKLFARVDKVYKQKDRLNLTVEQQRLLDAYYKKFKGYGVHLALEKKKRFKKIDETLSANSLKFAYKVIDDIKQYKLVIDKKKDLAGLPQHLIDIAAGNAKQHKMPGKWVFLLRTNEVMSFLRYADNRDLRKQIYTAFTSRGHRLKDKDTRKLVLEQVKLRLEKARLLGYKTYAHLELKDRMAKTPETVFKFLQDLWKPALKKVNREARELREFMRQMGQDFELEPWDWRYYAEKLKAKRYGIHEDLLRPYFQLENVIDGVSITATKLFGITFHRLKNVPLYHPDALAYEVKDADGSHLGIIYQDYYTRDGKDPGGSMRTMREQSNIGGKMVRPVGVSYGSFTRPTSDKPSLLTMRELDIMFHEFGHGLHTLLSNITYRSLSGYHIAQDFIELPSQMFANWSLQPEVLKLYAKHYKTGETIPMALVEKIKEAETFNQGYSTIYQLVNSFIDMEWHSLESIDSIDGIDVLEFEKKIVKKLGLSPHIMSPHRSTHFFHLFSGGYAAGYYSYLWSEALDADAFSLFKEKGIFDKETARAFRVNILKTGSSQDPMTLYKKFRGHYPNLKPLLKKKGLN